MFRYRATFILIAAAGGMLLTGCGPAKPTAAAPAGPVSPTAAPIDNTSAPAKAAASGLPDPCSLITEDVASTALGKASGPGVPGGNADSPQCLYGNGVLIIAVDSTGKDGFDSNHSSMTQGPAGTWQDVNGVGEGAFEVNGGPTALVYFYKGTKLFEIMLQGELKPPAQAAITVATAAAANA